MGEIEPEVRRRFQHAWWCSNVPFRFNLVHDSLRLQLNFPIFIHGGGLQSNQLHLQDEKYCLEWLEQLNTLHDVAAVVSVPWQVRGMHILPYIYASLECELVQCHLKAYSHVDNETMINNLFYQVFAHLVWAQVCLPNTSTQGAAVRIRECLKCKSLMSLANPDNAQTSSK